MSLGVLILHLFRGPKRRKDIVREGWAYHVSRWPLLVSPGSARPPGRSSAHRSRAKAIIFLVIFLEFLGYLAVRQLVNIFEYLVAWRGYRGKLRAALRNASTFEEVKPTPSTYLLRMCNADSFCFFLVARTCPRTRQLPAPLRLEALASKRVLRLSPHPPRSPFPTRNAREGRRRRRAHNP